MNNQECKTCDMCKECHAAHNLDCKMVGNNYTSCCACDLRKKCNEDDGMICLKAKDEEQALLDSGGSFDYKSPKDIQNETGSEGHLPLGLIDRF